MITVPMQVSVTRVTVPVSIGAGYDVRTYEEYEGATEFTPTQETQTVGTAGKYVARDITINPIPNNYGLITYNGGVITVS